MSKFMPLHVVTAQVRRRGGGVVQRRGILYEFTVLLFQMIKHWN